MIFSLAIKLPVRAADGIGSGARDPEIGPSEIYFTIYLWCGIGSGK